MNLRKSMLIALAMRGHTQQSLSLKLGHAESYINVIIRRGDISLTKLLIICEALEMSVSDFLKMGE